MTSAAEQLAALVDEYFERNLELNPLTASMIGDSRYNDRLGNYLAPEYRAKTTGLNREFLKRLEALDPESLDGQDRLTYETFRPSRTMDLEGDRYPSHLQPLNQFFSFPNFFVQLGSGASVHKFETVKDYEDFLGRVDDYVMIVDQAIENMREGARQGIVQPRVLMEKTLPQLESQLADDVEESTFYKPVREMPEGFSDADREPRDRRAGGPARRRGLVRAPGQAAHHHRPDARGDPPDRARRGRAHPR